MQLDRLVCGYVHVGLAGVGLHSLDHYSHLRRLAARGRALLLRLLLRCRARCLLHPLALMRCRWDERRLCWLRVRLRNSQCMHRQSMQKIHDALKSPSA